MRLGRYADRVIKCWHKSQVSQHRYPSSLFLSLILYVAEYVWLDDHDCLKSRPVHYKDIYLLTSNSLYGTVRYTDPGGNKSKMIYRTLSEWISASDLKWTNRNGSASCICRVPAYPKMYKLLYSLSLELCTCRYSRHFTSSYGARCNVQFKSMPCKPLLDGLLCISHMGRISITCSYANCRAYIEHHLY